MRTADNSARLGIGKYPGYPKPEFGDVKSIFILADTGRAELAITNYNQSGSDIEGGGFIVETAKFPLTQEAVFSPNSKDCGSPNSNR
jgi:hypothetical protein